MAGPLEPTTGYHFIHVVPEMHAYQDILQCYRHVSSRLPWMETLTFPEWMPRREEELRKPENCAILWGHHFDGDLDTPPAAKLVVHFSEWVGNPEDLTTSDNNQRNAFERFLSDIGRFDAVFCHTPTIAKKMSELAPKANVHVAPIGYEPEVMGRPDWGKLKRNMIVFCGSRTFRRRQVLGLFSQYLPITDISNNYGLARKGLLDESRATIYIHHMPGIVAFATFRIWQTIASSAVLISEPMDTWPSVPGRHHIEIPWVTQENVREVSRSLGQQVMDSQRCLAMARLAHKELSSFSAEQAMKDYILPVARELRK